MLADCPDDLVVAVDTAWQDSVNKNRHADYVHCTSPYSREVLGDSVYLTGVLHDRTEEEIHGEWMGFLKISAGLCDTVAQRMEQLLDTPAGRTSPMADLINSLIADGYKVRVLYTTGNWIDIDIPSDLILAGRFQ
jgi:phosphoenolpyruvate phosphomutase